MGALYAKEHIIKREIPSLSAIAVDRGYSRAQVFLQAKNQTQRIRARPIPIPRAQGRVEKDILQMSALCKRSGTRCTLPPGSIVQALLLDARFRLFDSQKGNFSHDEHDNFPNLIKICNRNANRDQYLQDGQINKNR